MIRRAPLPNTSGRVRARRFFRIANLAPTVLPLLVLAAVILCAVVDHRERAAWETFAVKHGCRFLARGDDGIAYQCDDGVHLRRGR